jgi:hypothetical protein
MTTSDALVACARLQVNMECGENAIFSLCEELLRAQNMYIAASIDDLSKDQADVASKIAMFNWKGLLNELLVTKLRVNRSFSVRRTPLN